MPRNARVVAPGLPYHITQRGTNREKVFYTNGDRKLYLRLIRDSQEEAGVQVLAYCLMSNHVHFIVVPEREDSLSVLFGRANGRFAQALNIERGRCGHLWQARFFSCPMSETHLWIGLRYVEENPCRAGLVESAAEYRWSSAAAHLLRGAGPDRHPGSRFLAKDRRSGDVAANVRQRSTTGRSGSGAPQMHLCRSAVRGRGFRRRPGGPLRTAVAQVRKSSRIGRICVNQRGGCPKQRISSVSIQAV